MLEWMSVKGPGGGQMREAMSARDGGVAAAGARSGLMAGTRVATAMGWRKVDALDEGDLVLTFDGGLQPVTRVARRTIWNGDHRAARHFWPLHVPVGALGNRDAMYLLTHQYVMIESDAGEDLFGDPFSLIQAGALAGVNGIEAVPPPCGHEAVVLHFEADQVIFAESGVLYYCPSACGLLDQAQAARTGSPYLALTAEDAEVLVMCIQCERATGRVWAQSGAPAGCAAVMA